jgi:hypothetical protein
MKTAPGSKLLATCIAIAVSAFADLGADRYSPIGPVASIWTPSVTAPSVAAPSAFAPLVSGPSVTK